VFLLLLHVARSAGSVYDNIHIITIIITSELPVGMAMGSKG